MKKKENTARRWSIPLIATGAASGALLLAAGGQAQEQGTLARFGLSFGGEYTANDAGDNESRLTSGLSFDLRSTTQTQSFGFSADSRLLLEENSFVFDNPTLALDYTRTSRSTALSLGASYRAQDVESDFTRFDPLTLDATDFIEDEGTQTTLNLTAGLRTGLDARFGTETDLAYTSRRYTDITNPDLTDLDTIEASTALRFDIDPLFTLRASASYRATDESGNEDSDDRTTSVGLGADLIIDPLWSASVDLQYTSIETESDDGFGNRILTEQDGMGFTAALNRQFRSGSLGFSLSRQITTNGAEDSVRLLGDTQRRNRSTLAWSLGLVSFENGDTTPTASIFYSLPTRSGSFTVDLQQTTAVNDEDNNVLRTVLNADYAAEINNRSSWSLNGSLASIDVVDSEAGDQLRAEIGVSYNHALTRNWDLSTGLRHSLSYEGGDRSGSASTLSFSLAHSFSFRP